MSLRGVVSEKTTVVFTVCRGNLQPMGVDVIVGYEISLRGSKI